MRWLCFLAVFTNVESTLVEGRMHIKPSPTQTIQLRMRAMGQLDRAVTGARTVSLCLQGCDRVLTECFYCRVKSRFLKLIADPIHPACMCFELLPSGKRYRSLGNTAE